MMLNKIMLLLCGLVWFVFSISISIFHYMPGRYFVAGICAYLALQNFLMLFFYIERN
jgi:hypothetical protein